MPPDTVHGEVEAFVKAQLREMLSDESEGIKYVTGGPTIVMIAGVNGSGKTTSITKLANGGSAAPAFCSYRKALLRFHRICKAFCTCHSRIA